LQGCGLELLQLLGGDVGRERQVAVLHDDLLALGGEDVLQELLLEGVQAATRVPGDVDVEEAGERVLAVEDVLVGRRKRLVPTAAARGRPFTPEVT